jgi:hypothetical protein
MYRCKFKSFSYRVVSILPSRIEMVRSMKSVLWDQVVIPLEFKFRGIHAVLKLCQVAESVAGSAMIQMPRHHR